MKSKTQIKPSGPYWRKQIVQLLGSGLIGFLLVFSMLKTTEGSIAGDLTGSQLFAILIGALYFAMGLFVGAGTLVPKTGSKVLNADDPEELHEQRGVLLYSSGSMMAWGAALAVLGLTGDRGPFGAILALVIASAGIFAGLYWAWVAYCRSDELMKAVNLEAGALSSFMTLAILGAWAALAHLGFAPAPAPLDLVSGLFALFLVATFIVTGRRGLLRLKAG